MNQVLEMSVVEELLSLSEDGDPELLLDLIELFLDDGPGKIEAVVDGLEQGDFEKIERAAHTLKGSSGNLGAQALQETCEQLQLATGRRDLSASQQLAPLVQSQFDEACQALRGLRQRFSQN
ncbi:MAG: Hpt domain-containing protein [Planctomycetota bacterium]|nr:Hpt domain-containing protein [Planctomycetota bacterium]